MPPARVSMPGRTGSPRRGQPSRTGPGGIASRSPVGTAARPPGAISRASLARGSAPAGPADAYSGSRPPSTGTPMGARMAGHATPATPALTLSSRDDAAEPLRAGAGAPRGGAGAARRTRLPRASGLRLALPQAGPVGRGNDEPHQGASPAPGRGLGPALARGPGALALLRRHAEIPLSPRGRRHHPKRLHPARLPPPDLHLHPHPMPPPARLLPHRHRRVPAQPEDPRDPG